MFKAFVTVLRGKAAQSAEQFTNRNALLILDQQMRDAVDAVERVKRALAIAIAQEKQEAQRLTATSAQITDLEKRVTAALRAGDNDMAREGAAAIASLEADRDTALAAQSHFSAEIRSMRHNLEQEQNRIADLQRGRRLARASEAARTLRGGHLSGSYRASLSEAEKTLRNLREQQIENDVADTAMDQLDDTATSINERLAAKGFGSPLKPTAEDVLARLRTGLNQNA